VKQLIVFIDSEAKMKTIIYYFSAIGNSLWVAKKIADKLGDTTSIDDISGR
jgi:flavodoxin